ncbi:MAG: HAD family hydrolase [Candidatus Scalinduaceae bacterium]
MTYKAAIFDLDGTLLDTLEDLGNAVNRVLTANGFPMHEIDAYRYYVGDGETMLITRALPEEKRSDKIIRSCLKEYRQDYGQNWNVYTKPYDGVEEMLGALVSHGLKLAILSNKPHEFTRLCVSGLLPKWTFDAVLGQQEPIPRKPDPAGALKIAEELEIPPSGFLYLGDTAIDMKTATAANMFPVGVLWGFRPAEELQQSGARVLIKRPMDIMNYLNSKSIC